VLLHAGHAGIGLTVSVLGAVALWAGYSRRWDWHPWLFAWLAAVNVVTLVYYAFDKARAGQPGASRVPEAVLHGLALIGGSLGAYSGMQLFRHKTMKGPFQVVFWAIVILQVGLLAEYLRRVYLLSPTS
jgi:uncharacterized membrane protein YsdA (DUF1294 family)